VTTAPAPQADSPGNSTAVFKDMVAALGPESASPEKAAVAGLRAASGNPSPNAPAPGSSGGAAGLTDMDMMLADLAFAARPPPVITPDETNLGEVPNGGPASLSPSAFSPSTMLNMVLGTPTPANTRGAATRSAVSATTKAADAASWGGAVPGAAAPGQTQGPSPKDAGDASASASTTSAGGGGGGGGGSTKGSGKGSAKASPKDGSAGGSPSGSGLRRSARG